MFVESNKNNSNSTLFTKISLFLTLTLLIPGLAIHIISYKSLTQQGRLLYEFKRARLDNATEFGWRLENNLQNKFFKRYLNNLLKNKYKAIGRANTLIIGNVHGFHKVGDALEGNERELIRITFRHNPIEVINKLTKPLLNFITSKN